MKIKTPTLILIIFLVILVVLAIIFFKKPSTQQGQEQTEIAKEIYGVSGTIEEIGQSALVVSALILQQDPSKAPLRQNVNVQTDSGTKIIKLEFPDPEDIPEGSTEPIYPKETELNFSDLQQGDKIDVQVRENISEKVKNKNPFTASIINVIE